MKTQETLILEMLKEKLEETIVYGNVSKFHIDAHLEDDLLMDFLDYADLSEVLEEEIGIVLPDEPFNTVREIVEYIQNNYTIEINE